MKKMWPVIVVIQLVLILVISVYAFVQSGIAKENLSHGRENLRLARETVMQSEMSAKETIRQRQIAEKLIEELRACQSKNGK